MEGGRDALFLRGLAQQQKSTLPCAGGENGEKMKRMKEIFNKIIASPMSPLIMSVVCGILCYVAFKFEKRAAPLIIAILGPVSIFSFFLWVLDVKERIKETMKRLIRIKHLICTVLAVLVCFACVHVYGYQGSTKTDKLKPEDFKYEIIIKLHDNKEEVFYTNETVVYSSGNVVVPEIGKIKFKNLYQLKGGRGTSKLEEPIYEMVLINIPVIITERMKRSRDYGNKIKKELKSGTRIWRVEPYYHDYYSGRTWHTQQKPIYHGTELFSGYYRKHIYPLAVCIEYPYSIFDAGDNTSVAELYLFRRIVFLNTPIKIISEKYTPKHRITGLVIKIPQWR